jgi:hypothetical protein
MLTRVETLKRNGTQQASYFQNFDERLQRLEDMQASTIQLLNVLVQNIQTSPHSRQTLIDSFTSNSSEKKTQEIEDDETLDFTALSSPDDVTLPISSLFSSGAGRTMRSSSFSNRKATNPIPVPNSAPPQIVVGSYPEFLSLKTSIPSTITASEERLGMSGATTILRASTSSLNVAEDTSHQNLYEAEETEHNIFGKLIKERFRKLSEVVEDIERTLPSHQQRRGDKCDTTDDDETLSTIDWVDTAGRMTFNSTRVSRFDINQDEIGQNLIATGTNNSKKKIKSNLFIFSYSRCRAEFNA